MKMMAGAACLACAKRSRTCDAPTPTNSSTNSEAEIEQKGTCASPAARGPSASCRSRAAPSAARRAGSVHPCAGTLGLAQEVDDLDQLGLRPVDARDVV